MNSNFIRKKYGTLCQTCLSVDRKLFPVGAYNGIFNNITNNTGLNFQSTLLCWECIAILKRIKNFTTQVEHAQWMLNNDLVNKKKCALKSLSRLSTKSYTDNNQQIIITYNDEDDEVKDEKYENDEEIDQKEFKQEIDSDDDYEIPVTETIHLQEIKKEKITDKKSLNTKNTDKKCYKNKNTEHNNRVKRSYNKTKYGPSRHYVTLSKSKKLWRKKFSLEKDNIKDWWGKEKESDFYKSFQYKCTLCVHGYDCKEKLEAHILKRHDESIGPFICEICHYRFSNENLLSIHCSTHEKTYQCLQCDFQSVTLRRMERHTDIHGTVQCVYCKRLFVDPPSFYEHYKALHTAYFCDHCGKKCNFKRTLQNHMRHHLPSHPCQVCSKTFPTLRSLQKHIWTQHKNSPPEERYCVLCNKLYSTIAVYRQHIVTSAAHRQETNAPKQTVQCPECSKTYARRISMMNHYRHVHMNQSKYYCQYCNRHFLNNSRLSEHMKYNHEGVKKEKNKLCNICGRGFAENRVLIHHIRTHSGERPFECEYCAAKFAQKTAMLYHVKYVHLKLKRKTAWQQ